MHNVTKADIINLLEKQIRESQNLISTMKDEGDLHYFNLIDSLRLAIEYNELLIDKINNSEELTQQDLQSWFNKLVADNGVNPN